MRYRDDAEGASGVEPVEPSVWEKELRFLMNYFLLQLMIGYIERGGSDVLEMREK